ncbi:SHOCT domain-containing protein [Hymenobacter frigidus]|nr:SHOCT domain-containing protein [Hymenobacter frigidus]
MQNLPSPLSTLCQLKKMLDAGALTPAEFEARRQHVGA